MAEKRMFTKSIVDSDKFLEMPLSTQALYFHLGMRADDEGFINSPQKIIRAVNCNEDDLKLLIAKGFVICFESGIIVITHWKLHNYIQKDRCKPTIYEAEKAQLIQKNNKEYALIETTPNAMDTSCIQDVSKMDTQYRSEEISTDKSSIDNNMSTSVDGRNAFDYQAVVNAFNSICVSLPKIQKLTDPRKKKIKALQHHLGDMSIDEYFKMVEQSDFLTGRAGDWNGCNFDWILNPTNLTKIIEGNYNNRQSQQQNTPQYTQGIDYF